MSKTISQIIALALVSCFVVCQPVLAAASTLNRPLLNPRSDGPSIDFITAETAPKLGTEQPSKLANGQKAKAGSAEKKITQNVSRAKAKKTSKRAYLNSAKNVRRLAAHHHKSFGDREDCDACHTQCLLASLACIAISAATACPGCAAICLVYHTACGVTCNTTTACKNSSTNQEFFIEN